tara:strand:+ start:522 stop:1793 length:1272 start_codon:yes stop_codon:yes gene_type:complete
MANYKDLKYVFPASSITSGTFNDARIAASNVSQHATSFDDNKIVNDISTLGLRVHTQENLNASNTNSASFDVFQDSSAVSNLTNVARDANEFMSAQTFADSTLTINNSNYTTYIDSVKGVQASNTLRPTGSNEFTAISNFDTVTDNTTYDGTNAGTGSAHLGTKGAYLFGNNGDSDSSYWRVNNNVAGAAANNYYFHTILLKLNLTPFNPASQGIALRDYSLKWRNGSGNFWWNQMYGSIDITGINTSNEDHASLVLKSGSGINNGTSYTASTDGTAQSSNTVKAKLIIIDQFHFNGTNSYMFDNLTITGLASLGTLNSSGSFTGTNITASSTNKMGAVITYQDNAGTNALNTDIVLQLSADGGSNFSTATLTALPDFATGIKMAKVNDLSVTAGTSLTYKISFANQASGSKEARIRGVSLQY